MVRDCQESFNIAGVMQCYANIPQSLGESLVYVQGVSPKSECFKKSLGRILPKNPGKLSSRFVQIRSKIKKRKGERKCD